VITIQRTNSMYLLLPVMLVVGFAAGIFSTLAPIQAQEMEAETYTVLAGADAPYNSTVLAFAPQSLQVHRGDTVTWAFGGFHNIHFESELAPLIIAPEVDGQPLPQVNPAIAFPTIENGATFQGGDVNSGIPLDPTAPMFTFSLIMDVEPGDYSYFCDIHPGMSGSISVVDSSVEIPSPEEAMVTAVAESATNAGAVAQAAFATAMQPAQMGDDGALQISAGLQVGAAHSLSFFPAVAVIDPGQSVTWTIPVDSREPHTVTAPAPPPGSEFNIIPQDAGPPIIALSETTFPAQENGAAIGAEGSFNTGFMMPGQSFTLTFTEPGVYQYVCMIHVGMNGTIVVMPTE
jgi:plastocyanin